MWCVWTAKGGSGASVVSAAMAVLAAQNQPTLLVDLGCDQPALLGLDPPGHRHTSVAEQLGAVRSGAGEPAVDELALDDPTIDDPAIDDTTIDYPTLDDPTIDEEEIGQLGVLDWLDATDPPPDALARLEVSAGPNLAVLPTGRLVGRGHPDGAGPAGDGRRAERLEVLSRLLRSEQRAVVVDIGAASHRYEPILARAEASILVTRACYLALRRTVPSRHVDRVVLVAEPGRSLRRSDIEKVLPVPVDATVRWDPSVARAVDAGTLRRRLPRPLRSLEALLRGLPTDQARNARPLSDAAWP